MPSTKSKGTKKDKKKVVRKERVRSLLQQQRKLRLGREVISRERLKSMFGRAVANIGFDPKEHRKVHASLRVLSAIIRGRGSEVVNMANVSLTNGPGVTITNQRLQTAIDLFEAKHPMPQATDFSVLRRPKKTKEKKADTDDDLF